MQFGPAGWTEEVVGWGAWLLWTAIGAGALWRYWSSIDRSGMAPEATAPEGEPNMIVSRWNTKTG